MKDRRLTKEEKSEIYRLYAQNTPTAIIAQEFMVSEAKIVRVLEDAHYINTDWRL